jgi:addiction module HigA family antidote
VTGRLRRRRSSAGEGGRSKRRVTAETALRFARHLGTSHQFWLGLQSDYDLDVAADELGERLYSEVQVRAQAS